MPTLRNRSVNLISDVLRAWGLDANPRMFTTFSFKNPSEPLKASLIRTQWPI